MKNDKLKSQNGSCVLRTGLLTPSAEKKQHKQMKQQFLTRTLFIAEGVLKIARSAQLQFLIFHF
jgi:hypothetical protein